MTVRSAEERPITNVKRVQCEERVVWQGAKNGKYRSDCCGDRCFALTSSVAAAFISFFVPKAILWRDREGRRGERAERH